ncbi:MAG: hypothetical protein P4L56_27365 [Candidatus Sulfopaludibacter sp.]|nr:hypothetical protein [Candidatus Sulfopaludibacter sp.]
MTGKYALLGLMAMLVSGPARSQRGIHRPPENPGLPVLNVMVSATLGPPYSCAPALSYATNGLFLSTFSQQQGPELLLNGACGAADYFDVNLAGDDISLIADLGPGVSLASLNTHQVFNLLNVNTPGDYTKFTWTANVVQGHTYAVVINSEYRRGLFVFTVTRFVPDQEVDLQYEVKDYQVNTGPLLRSQGFDWNQ